MIRFFNSILMMLSMLSCCWKASAQIDEQQMKTVISLQNSRFRQDISTFYTYLGYQAVWTRKSSEPLLAEFVDVIKSCKNIGLNQNDYDLKGIDSVRYRLISLKSTEDSLRAEMRIATAAIRYCSDLHYGNTEPALAYRGVSNHISYRNVIAELAAHVLAGDIASLADGAAAFPEISVLFHKLMWFNQVLSSANFSETTISSNQISTANYPLMSKLYQLGLIDTITATTAIGTLRKKINDACSLFNLPAANAVLPTKLLHELNVPVATRADQLTKAINDYRWLRKLSAQYSTIVVNIPSADLKVYRNDSVIMQMRTIVGKPATPTPALSSWISSIVAFPYWYVPRKIAIRELLPVFKKNPGYVDAGNFQLLDKNGEVVTSVQWQTLNSRNFPYTVRQSTGCDNSLGVLKFDFYNPFTVYLHDTPDKKMFEQRRRYFSHGCMRVQKPLELSRLILQGTAVNIDSILQKHSAVPINIAVNEQFPLVVWYNPAGVDTTGNLIFFEDPYNKFPARPPAISSGTAKPGSFD